MTIEKYRHPFLFYGLATLIPWLFWFGAAYLSHLVPGDPGFHIVEKLTALTGVSCSVSIAFFMIAGLFGPMIIAFWMMAADPDLRNDLLKRVFVFKDRIAFLSFNDLFFNACQHSAGPGGLFAFRSQRQSVCLVRTIFFFSRSAAGLVSAFSGSGGGRAGLALLWNRLPAQTAFPFYNLHYICRFLGPVAFSPVIYQRLLSQQPGRNQLDLFSEFFSQPDSLCSFNELALL